MKLLDRPMDRPMKDELLNLLDRCICRIDMSDDGEEIICMLGFGIDSLAMFAYSKIKELKGQANENA